MAAENTEAAFSGQKPDLVAGIAGNAAKVFHTHIILSVQGNKHGSFCQIIRELEQRPRGIYGGAISYLDFTGNLDVCISIRLAYKKNGVVCVQSGAGIVYDSVPETEYLECRNKARAVVAAIEAAEGGIQ